MRPHRFSALIAFLILASSSTLARADFCTAGSHAAYFDLSLQSDGYFPGPCDITPAGASARVYVRAVSIPFQKARITLPDIPGVTVVNESWGVSFTGNHTTGVELDMGSCVGPFNDRSAPVLIGYIDVVWGSPAYCTLWKFSQAEVQDCAGGWRPVFAMDQRVGPNSCGQCIWQLCFWPMAPYDLQPPNGATGIPLNVVLTWKNLSDPLPPFIEGSHLYINGAPSCTGGGYYAIPNNGESFAPDFLEPGRTYYWQPYFGYSDGGCQDTNGTARGPLYSFTTEGTIATKPSTWSYVKSLYRE